MRILLLTSWWPWPDTPGMAPWVRERVHALARGHPVAVLAARRGAPGGRAWAIREEIDGDVPTVHVTYPGVPTGRLGFLLGIAGMWSATRRLRRSGFRPDVIHAISYISGAAAVVLGRVHGVPVVIGEHYTGFPRGEMLGLDLRAARFAYERADLVCPDSLDLQRHIQALGVRARFEQVDNFIDTSAFAPRRGEQTAPAEGPLRLANVAALEDKKGHRFLLEALALLRDRGRDVELEVAGEGSLRGELERLSERLGVADRVRFHGLLDKSRIGALLRRAHVFVLPSLFENQPHAVMEALAAGLPVVATQIGGVGDLVEAPTGLVVAPGDPGALAGAIEEVASSLERYPRAALAALAEERFGIAQGVARWDEVYSRVLDRRGKLPASRRASATYSGSSS